MTFRTRLLAGFGVVVLVPLAVFGLGIRRAMSGRLAAEYERRVSTLADVIRTDITRQSDGIATRLGALKAVIAADNRFRSAVIQGGDRAYVLDYAGDAMRLTGLDFLQILDDEARVVSSGHFRNEYDRPAALPPPGGPALVAASTAESSFLALVRRDTLRLPGRRFTLVGGVRVDSLFLARLLRVSRVVKDQDLSVSVELPGDSAHAADTRPVVAALELPYVGSGDVGAHPARIVVTQSEGLYGAVRRDVNTWFAVAVLVSALLAVFIAGWLSTRFSRPMTEMEHRAALGDLARQVTHDIKNGLGPLRNVFRHFTQVAQSEPKDLPNVFAERQGTVESSIAYLETLATNYARLYPQVNERPTDLNTVVREAARRADVQTRLADALPAVHADPLVVRRVIENLLGNAVDSLEGKPGTVTIATERGPNGTVRLSVSDTGRGMNTAEVDRAFDDFYTTKQGGTGLGLSIVRRLVLDAHGTLNVESHPGKGSRFIVEFPVGEGNRRAL